jgi:hypothetical protein
MPQSVRHLLLALVAVVATVALPRPALAQSAPDNGVGPAIPVLMQGVSFINEADDQAATGTQAPPPQKSHHNGPGIGVKGGWAFAGFSGATNFQANTGWQIGLFLGGNRTGVFGVATEITFIQRNASAIFNTTISSSSKALEIPLLFRFNIWRSSRMWSRTRATTSISSSPAASKSPGSSLSSAITRASRTSRRTWETPSTSRRTHSYSCSASGSTRATSGGMSEGGAGNRAALFYLSVIEHRSSNIGHRHRPSAIGALQAPNWIADSAIIFGDSIAEPRTQSLAPAVRRAS